MRKIFSIAFTITFAYSANSQIPNNQDCLGAIPISQNIYSQTSTFVGTGNIPNEINGTLSCLGTGEKNDVWYSYCTQTAGNLCFTITPNNVTDDYDWAVFNLTNDTCPSIATNAALEVGCNYSAITGATGPNGLGGSQDGPCISVSAGERYLINVSHFSASPYGYNLDFSTSTCLLDATCSTPYTADTCAMSITVNASQNVLCFGDSTGSASVTVSSSYSSSFSYQWSNGDTDSVATDLSAGTYTIIVTNNLGCTDTNIFSIVEQVPIVSNVSIAPIYDSTCSGSANLSVSGGTYPYNYQWSNGNTGALVFNLCTGTYYVTITDASGCTKIDSAMIDSCKFNFNYQLQYPLCFGDSSGIATVYVANNYPPYSYQWSNGQTDSVASGLSDGNYFISVTDSNGCTAIREITMYNPSPLSFSLPTQDCSSSSACDGWTHCYVYGGVSPYYLQWSNGQSGPNNPNLCAGTYYVTATDHNGCSVIDSVIIGVTSGINQLSEEKSNFKIYPNPTTGKIEVISIQYSVKKITVYNILGEEIYCSPITDLSRTEGRDYRLPITINLSDFPNGIYFMKLVLSELVLSEAEAAEGIKTGEKVFVEKIVKM